MSRPSVSGECAGSALPATQDGIAVGIAAHCPIRAQHSTRVNVTVVLISMRTTERVAEGDPHVRRPILFPTLSVNQIEDVPLGPATIPVGLLCGGNLLNSVIFPSREIRPILLALASVNQRLPSGPDVMAVGLLSGVNPWNSVIAPAGVIRPIVLRLASVKQRLPSRPEVIAGWVLVPIGRPQSMSAPVQLM